MAPQVFDWSHILYNIPGWGALSGWASDDDVCIFEPIEIFEEEWGRDGQLYGLANAKKGTVNTLKLSPGSENVAIFQAMLKDWHDGNLTPFEGSYLDTDKHYGATLIGGLPYEIPPVQAPGQIYEPKIIWEKVIPLFGAEAVGSNPAQSSGQPTLPPVDYETSPNP